MDTVTQAPGETPAVLMTREDLENEVERLRGVVKDLQEKLLFIADDEEREL